MMVQILDALGEGRGDPIPLTSQDGAPRVLSATWTGAELALVWLKEPWPPPPGVSAAGEALLTLLRPTAPGCRRTSASSPAMVSRAPPRFVTDARWLEHGTPWACFFWRRISRREDLALVCRGHLLAAALRQRCASCSSSQWGRLWRG